MLSTLPMRTTQRSGGLHLKKQSVICVTPLWLPTKGRETLQLWETWVRFVNPFSLGKLGARSDQHPEFHCIFENVGKISAPVPQTDGLQHFDSQSFLFQVKRGCVPCLTIPGEIYLKLYFWNIQIILALYSQFMFQILCQMLEDLGVEKTQREHIKLYRKGTNSLALSSNLVWFSNLWSGSLKWWTLRQL